MPNPYGYLGAAGGAAAGVSGAEALAKVLSDQERQRQGWEELGIRREALAGEAEGRRQRYELGVREADQREAASRLMAAGEAAKYGQFGGLADITGLPPEGFSHFVQPPHTLEGLLTTLLTTKGQQEPGAPQELGADQPVRIAGEDQPGGVEFGTDPRSQGVLRAMMMLAQAHRTPTGRDDPFEEHMRDVYRRIQAGTASDDDKKQWTAYEAHKTGMTDPALKSGWATYNELMKKKGALQPGEKLSALDEESLTFVKKVLESQSTWLGQRPGLETAGLNIQQQNANQHIANLWAANVKAANKEVNDLYTNWSKSFGKMKEQNRQGTLDQGVQTLETLKSLAPTPAAKAEVDAAIKRWKDSMEAPPKPGSLLK